MEDLNRTQLIMLVLLVSFITSLVTGIVTVSLVEQTPSPITQTINKVIEKISPYENKEQAASLVPALIPFQNQEEAIIKAVKNVSPSVVSVVATKDISVIEEYYINPFPGLMPDLQIPQYRQKGTEKKQVSSGTGFFISKDGLLLTNKHVVEDTKAEYSVILNDGRKLEAKVLARDPFQDIAIIKVTGDNFTPIPFGDSDSVNVGQSVIAIGNALGEFRNTVSVGIISGLHRSVTAEGSLAGPEQLQELIQTDAAINPGNSGGPLIDLSGKVIGINTAIAQSAQNIGFALPINIAKRDVNDAIDFGKIKYPYITDIKEGDVILEIDGVKIDQQNNLEYLLSKHRVGDKVNLKIMRDGKEMTVTVTLGERPENL
jgi:S1-C subfamily serine protease